MDIKDNKGTIWTTLVIKFGELDEIWPTIPWKTLTTNIIQGETVSEQTYKY